MPLPEKYKEIAHHFNHTHSDLEKDAIFFKWLIGRNFKETNVDGIEALKAIKDFLKIYVSEHVSHCDNLLYPYSIYTNDLRLPRFAATEYLFKIPYFEGWLKRHGAFVVKKNHTSLFLDYLTHLICEEGSDLFIYPGIAERRKNKSFSGNHKKETGRSWVGKHQEFTRSFLIPAERAYNKDIDVSIIPSSIIYNSSTPEEKIFHFRTKYNLPFIGIADLLYSLIPLKKREISAYIRFGEPYPFSQLMEMFSDVKGSKRFKAMASFLEQKTKELYMPTSVDLLCGAVRMLGDGREYLTSDIAKKAEEMYEILDGKLDLSLIDRDGLEDGLDYRRVFGGNTKKIHIKNPFLLEYHSNRLLDLL